MPAPSTQQFKGSLSNLARACLQITKAKEGEKHSVQPSPGVHFSTQGVGRFLALCPREQENKVPGMPGLPNKLLLEHNRDLSSACHSECNLLIFSGFVRRWRTARQEHNIQELKISPGLSKQWNFIVCLFITATSLHLHTWNLEQLTSYTMGLLLVPA